MPVTVYDQLRVLSTHLHIGINAKHIPQYRGAECFHKALGMCSESWCASFR